MASTNFKLFDENKANMMSDTEYNINAQRLNGVQAGIASSQLQNKTLYQTSLVAYSLAQIMMQNGYNANDSAAVSDFVGNMSNSLLQKVLDKATTAEAQNGVNNTKWMTPALTKAAIDILAAKSQNILSDSTKTLYGLDSSAVPNDVLAELGKYKQYWWRRRVHTVTWEISTTSTGTNITVSSNATVQYADSIHVEFDGTIVLDDPKTSVPANYDNRDAFNNAIKNYWKYGEWTNRSNVWYGGSPVTSWSGDYPNLFTNLKQVIATKTSENIGEWEFIQDTNRNAYPDSGNKDGFDYQYIGVPLDNAVTAPKIETGSYVGTGTYGYVNPNTLTFGFTPKMVFMTDGANSFDDRYTLFFPWLESITALNITRPNQSSYELSTTISGNTISWFNGTNAGFQWNTANHKYCYLVIG